MLPKKLKNAEDVAVHLIATAISKQQEAEELRKDQNASPSKIFELVDEANACRKVSKMLRREER